MSNHALNNLVGKTLGHYTLVREAGRGGMSTVYEAIDNRLGRTVALKVLEMPMSLLAGHQDVIARLEREARAIASLSHPNVVTVYDVGAQEGLHYIVMEFLDGTTLRDRLQQGPLTPHETELVLTQVAEGLDAVHRQGVLHRDIKSANVMLLYNGRVKLLDFGIARTDSDTTLTQVGTMVGSPPYLAPELVTGSKASRASDIWALSVLLYEMLAGRLPFPSETTLGTLYRIANTEPDPLPEVDPKIASVVLKSLAKDPEARFPSGRALSEAFHTALTQATPVSVPSAEAYPFEPEPVGARPKPYTPRRFPLSAFAAVAFLLIVGALAISSFRFQNKLALGSEPISGQPVPAALRESAGDSQSARVQRAEKPPVSATREVPAPEKKAEGTTPERQRPALKQTVVKQTETRKPVRIAPQRVEREEASPSRVVRQQAQVAQRIKPDLQANREPRKSELSTQGTDLPAEDEGEGEVVPSRAIDRNQPETEADRDARISSIELHELLNEWIAATNAQNIRAQMRFYSPSLTRFYLQQNVSLAKVRAEKRRVFSGASQVQIQAGEPEMRFSPDGRTATMRFRKDYIIEGDRGRQRGAVLQELRWRLTEDGWKIISERDLRVL